MRPIVFVDTETTGLRLGDDVVWEVAAIRRDDEQEASGYPEVFSHPGVWEHGVVGDEAWRVSFQIEHTPPADGDLPKALHEAYAARWRPETALPVVEARSVLRELLRPNSEGTAIWVGATPDFDATRIQLLLGEQPWDYHLIDAPTLALGARGFSAKARRLPLGWGLDAACRAYGIDPKSTDRHTAMYDAELVEELFDRATVGAYRIDR